MASTYTLNNGIELIGTGEQSGTWGDTTNTNLSLLDTALDGQVTVTLASAGTSGSPNTLPISDGAASDGRNRMVIFNDGADLGATAYVQLTPNDAEKIIYIRNDLAGSRSIILFQGTYNASNDYEVPAGTTAVIYFDGAGSGAVAANVFNNAYFDSLRLGSVSVTEIIDDDTMATAAATNIATSESIKAYVDAQVGANNELSEVLANGNTTGGTDIAVSSGDDITFADSSKAIFGAGSDLQIYHDGSNSRINDAGTGNLIIEGANIVIDGANGNRLASFVSGGRAELQYDGSEKLRTTNTGVDVTGTINIDSTSFDPASGWGASQDVSPAGLNFEDNGTTTGNLLGQTYKTDSVTWGTTRLSGFFGMEKTNGTGNGDFVWWLAPTNFAQNPSIKMRIASNNDITFYDTSGNASFVYDESAGSTFNENGDNKDFRVESDSNTHALYVDASESSVSINSSNMQATGLHVSGTTNSEYRTLFVTNPADVTKGVAIAYDTVNDRGVITSVDTGVGWKPLYIENTSLTIDNSLTVNEAGSNNDFRVESDSNTHALFVDASAEGGQGAVGIGTNAPNRKFVISEQGANGIEIDPNISGTSEIISFDRSTSSYTGLNFAASSIELNASGAVIVNQGGIDADFRVESDNNTHALFVDAGNDRVGINQSSPQAMLDIKGNTTTYTGMSKIYLTDVSGNPSSRNWAIGNGGSDYGNFTIGVSNVATGDPMANGTHKTPFIIQPSGSVVINEDSNDADFRVESDTNTHALFVDAGADAVGVGTSDPTSIGSDTLVQISGTAGASVSSTLLINAGYAVANRNHGIGFSIAGYQPSTFIQTTEASGSGALLEFYSSASYTSPSPVMNMQLSAGASVFNEDSADMDFRVESNSQGHALFVDAGTDSLRFTVNGGYATYVESNGDGTRYVTKNTAHTIGFSSGSTYATGSEYAFIKITGGAASTVDVVSDNNGVRLANNATSWSSLSDSRLKTVTGTFDNAIADVKTLEPVRFTWNHDASNRTNVGLLAQSVQAVLPEAVNSGKHFEDDETEYLSVRYTEVIPLLTAALQEAVTKIETLEARIAALENA